MNLQSLIEFFNARFEQEFETGVGPFTLQDGGVQGLFGPIRIGSHLEPIRETLVSSQIIGHLARLSIVTNKLSTLQGQQPKIVEADLTQPRPHYESIINLDRLSRAVHLLNYLSHARSDDTLFVDVDPRHILAVKDDHGSYFEEMILKCGLRTSNITISLVIDDVCMRFYSALLKGLENYQRRGYRLALKFNCPTLEKTAIELVSRAAPDYLALSADYLDPKYDNGIFDKLNLFTRLAKSIDSASILLNVDDKNSGTFSKEANFELVQGRYFEKPAQLAKSKPVLKKAGEPAGIGLSL